ncbi:MAG: hypothetical protein ACFFC7_04115 [Candidatus Hermodarchaeota archaeon]
MPEVRIVVPDQMEKALDALIRAGFAGNKAELVRGALIQYLSTLPTDLSKEYDLNTIFSPDGRILQIEYAIEATKRGRLAVGIRTNEGIVICKNIQPRYSFHTQKSYFREIKYITDRIAVSFAGLTKDIRLVLRKALNYVETIEKGKEIHIGHLVEELGFFVHSHTLKKDLRVLGGSLLIGGLDLNNIPRLFVIEPSGSEMDVKYFAMGLEGEKALEILENGYNESLSLKETIMIAMKATIQEKKDLENVLIDVIDIKSRKFEELALEEKKKLWDKLD